MTTNRTTRSTRPATAPAYYLNRTAAFWQGALQRPRPLPAER